jgi:hypothetical protein
VFLNWRASAIASRETAPFVRRHDERRVGSFALIGRSLISPLSPLPSWRRLPVNRR